MQADAQSLLSLFEGKIRFEVPLFQRQYVWGAESQWEPLWEDIARKFTEHLDGRKDGPVHFLGALVLDQKQTPIKYVPKRQVVDGQQRLTTCQIFLAAFRDFCRTHGCEVVASECEKYTTNTGMMADPETERFKVWPTQLDRPLFVDVMSAGSRQALEKRYPLRKKKYARRYEPRPRLVDAYLFFDSKLRNFFIGTTDEPPMRSDRPLEDRVDDCLQALTYAIKVVTIDLQAGDDAQIIFETLNARGEPLLPADLLRNFIFLRAVQSGGNPEALYRQHWEGFDDAFWRQEVRQGRLVRPRSDLFMQHFVASHRVTDIPIKHLYVEYKYWLERFTPFASIDDELRCLAEQREAFRRFLEPKDGDPSAELARVLEIFDVSTAYPLLLAFERRRPSAEEWARLTQVIVSFLVRRSVCGWTTKAYNRLFLSAIKNVEGDSFVEGVTEALLSGKGESVGWPGDEEFLGYWMNAHAYKNLNNARLVYVLSRLSDALLTTKMEQVTIRGPLSVEHLLPQNWAPNWSLENGDKGLTALERLVVPPEDPARQASDRRDRVLQTLGNLTILTQPLNSSVSNGSWKEKKPAIMQSSLLPINQVLHDCDRWDEEAIQGRGKMLFELARVIWPRG